MTNVITISSRPRRESDRMVTERARHIYDLASTPNRHRLAYEAPVGFCGRRIKTGNFVAGLSILAYRQISRHRSWEAAKPKLILTRDLCPACEQLVTTPVPYEPSPEVIAVMQVA